MSDTDRANPKPPHLDRLSLLWRRVNDHKIAQWSVAYIALAYGTQHAVTLITEAFEWPHAVERLSMLLLALGLPVVMTLAWYHGARASRRISGPELTIIAILLAMGSLFFYVLVKPSQEASARSTPALQQASLAAARSAAASLKGAISVAVLPFVNLSSDKEQEFFSDGMTEEITAALAKVPDMRVVARTSAFEFKGKNVDIGKIGEQLHATHLIEGSVRKAGNRVRITAQLVKADDGTHIWAEDYDRELTDVFAIQEDIARAITASLHMTLGLKPGENLVNNRKIDPESYTEYLRIKAGVTARGNQVAREQAVAELEKLLARQPDFAPAWAYLADLRVTNTRPLGVTMWTRPVDQTRAMAEKLLQQAEHDAREAIRLDAMQAYAYLALAQIETCRGNWANAEDFLKRAAQADANEPQILTGLARFSLQTGHIDDALKLSRDAQALDPLSLGPTTAVGVVLLAQNQPKAAVELLEAHPDRRLVGFALLAHAYAANGQFEKAADLIAGNKGGPVYRNDPKGFDAAEALMRSLAAKKPPPKLYPNPDYNWIFAYSDQPEQLMSGPERHLQVGLLGFELVFDVSLAPVRKTERFKKFLRDAGLVNYWRARGWPDVCHPVGTDDFACE